MSTFCEGVFNNAGYVHLTQHFLCTQPTEKIGTLIRNCWRFVNLYLDAQIIKNGLGGITVVVIAGFSLCPLFSNRHFIIKVFLTNWE